MRVAKDFAFRLFAGCLILFSGSCKKPVSGALTHEAYVWQRNWTNAIAAGIEASRGELAGYVVLTGEISFHRGEPEFFPARPDFATLHKMSVPVALALRIGPFPGPFSGTDSIARFIKAKIRDIQGRATGAGLVVTEWQIDFDCAQSKLAGYAAWLEAIRLEAGKVPVVITALPSWLGEPDFAMVAREGYVLQVHSVQNPTSHEATLFDSAKARRWVAKAGQLGHDFRVALPTYSQQLAGVPPRFLRSDPVEIAGFLRALNDDHPRKMSGIIWYRLPLPDTQEANWRWETLCAVIQNSKLTATPNVRLSNGPPSDVWLENSGNCDLLALPHIEVVWEKGELVASDAFPGWSIQAGKNSVVFSPRKDFSSVPLPPGGKLAIGWVRVENGQNIRGHPLP